MLKAVIFDFDGVVSDSEPVHYKSYVHALKPYGIELTKDQYYARYVGYTDEEGFEVMAEDFPEQLKGVSCEQLVNVKAVRFKELVRSEHHIFDGVESLVRMLLDNGIRVAICSGAKREEIEIMLEGSNIADAFEFIVASEDVVKGKPDPEPYLLALSKLNLNGDNISAGQCVVIEDSHWGLEAANAAGMNTVGVTNTYGHEGLSMADCIVESLADLNIEDLRRMCRAD
jgi:beta-phosphoglucomutase